MNQDLNKQEVLDVFTHGDNSTPNVPVVTIEGHVQLIPRIWGQFQLDQLNEFAGHISTVQQNEQCIGPNADKYINQLYRELNEVWHRYQKTGKTNQTPLSM